MKPAVMVALGCTLAGCAAPEIRVVQRVANPSKRLDAVQAQCLTDATVSTPTEVYVLSSGSNVTGEPVFRADHVEGFKMSWHHDDKLTIEADKARIFLRAGDTVVAGMVVRIELKIRAEEP